MPLEIALLQMVSTPSVEDNLRAACELLRQAADAGAELAVLPEYFCLLGRSDTDKLAHAEDEGTGPIQQALADAARDLGLWVVGGTLPLRSADPGRVRNTTLAYTPDGRCVARYDKIHLFRFDNGGERYDEARTIEAGAQAACFDLAAPAQGGEHANGRRTWGHSMVVDPWGQVMACREAEGQGLVRASLDLDRLARARRQLPALEHRVL